MRMSGRYPWGKATLYPDVLAFWAKVKECEDNGVDEDVIVEAINETLPTEWKMSMRTFRAVRSKAIHELRIYQIEQITTMREAGIRWTEIARKLEMAEATVRMMYRNKSKWTPEGGENHAT